MSETPTPEIPVKEHSYDVQGKLKDRFLSRQDRETTMLFQSAVLILLLSITGYKFIVDRIMSQEANMLTAGSLNEYYLCRNLFAFAFIAGIFTLISMLLEARSVKDVFRNRFHIYKGTYHPKYKYNPKYNPEELNNKLKVYRQRLNLLSRATWILFCAEVLLMLSGFIVFYLV